MPGGAQIIPGPIQPGMSQPDYRPLNVKDALTYLDQVKFQFSDQPDVYNRFLDIMKDFKSQAYAMTIVTSLMLTCFFFGNRIDTPGVIERVSNLFRGHPSLIVGFNTFLPPGYKIEVSQTAAGQTYTITTPDSQHYVNAYSGAPITFQQTIGTSVPSYQPPAIQQQQQQQSAAVKKTPVEFNHAINYVNKIKNRFVNEPEVYKQFLEILRTYQNESKPISEVFIRSIYLAI
jgi:paired amphipathic helix protein Sin3a